MAAEQRQRAGNGGGDYSDLGERADQYDRRKFTAAVTLSEFHEQHDDHYDYLVCERDRGREHERWGRSVRRREDSLVGVYTAPATVPTTTNGQVNITATTPQMPGSTTNSNLITSNTAMTTVTIGNGLSVSSVNSAGSGGRDATIYRHSE